ncbi:MAG: hypothetical protein OEW15_07765 [Nitrospirota bacterium]|nr:hypothetical protein [Nitrospirota bacterium]
MDKLRAAYRVVVIIGLAIMASLVVYAVIVGLFENGTIPLGGTAMAGGMLDMIKFVFLGISAALFPLMRFLSSRIINADASQTGSPAEFGPLTTAAIVTFALCEVPAIFGLVLYVLGRNTTDFYLFLLISSFFFGTNFPKFSQWEEWHRRKSGGQRRP